MYTLRREGTFWGVPHGCCHCGPDHEPREYGYSYEITTYNRGIDSSGFILDNRVPQQWFDDHGRDGFEESCELLARKAAYAFCRMCRSPYSIRVCIVGFETARAEYFFYCQCLPMRVVGLTWDYCYDCITYYVPLIPQKVRAGVEYVFFYCWESGEQILNFIRRFL